MTLTRRSLLQLLGIGSAALALRNHDAVSADSAVEADASDRSGNTLLESFLRSRGIKPAHLARESGYSRQHLLRIRLGRTQPSLCCIAGIVIAIRRLTREDVRAEHLFDAHVIRAVWRDVRLGALQDEDREAIRAAFGRTLFLGVRA